jgi:hypothetical protein
MQYYVSTSASIFNAWKVSNERNDVHNKISLAILIFDMQFCERHESRTVVQYCI